MELTQEFIDNLKIDNDLIIAKISETLNIPLNKVNATAALLKDDNSVPFISRYRKEATGFLDEIEVRDISHNLISFENLESRRNTIIKNIFEQGMLTEDLYENIMKTNTLIELEEIYAPYKKKKKTRAMIAIAKGLEPLAELMLELEDYELEVEAEKFINSENDVNTIEEALQGAMDIIAERVAHDIERRNEIKDFVFKNANLLIEGQKDEEQSVYKMYYNYSEPLKNIKSHRILAINRGEREEELKVTIDFDEEKCLELLLSNFTLPNKYKKDALKDGLERLMIPSVNRELRTNFSNEADDHGIGVFSKNLNSLLLQPPIKRTRLIGIDPGIRTGSKGAALDETGKFLGYFVFYNHNKDEAKKTLLDAIIKYKAELIAIGNGTGTREVQEIVAETISDNVLEIQYAVVDEDGASVYSASDTAREEFPDLDLTIRGAISIGRRLQDPLAELVKIDPKSIGVGLYQHDLNQTKLSDALNEVVESVVNNVGVNLNTSSFSLLKYVSGINNSLAKNIVEYRNNAGLIKSREELRKIQGIGDKTFEQAAGFLKIQESENPLDNTWVHPENYEVASEVLGILNKNKLLKNDEMDALTKKYGISKVLIEEIIQELKKPNRDPRDDYPQPIFQKNAINFDDLKVGMKVTGKIKNVVDFGAFVDIGIKETALLHISQMSNTYINNPHLMFKVGDIVECSIIDIDTVRKRISVSMKSAGSNDNRIPKERKPSKEDLYKKYVIN